MVRLLLTLCIVSFLFTPQTNAQGISGDWYGKLEIYGNTIRINFHITETNENFVTTMDSPDQGAYGIPTDTTGFKNNSLFIKINAANVEFNGVFEKNAIAGTFTQNGFTLPLNLSREVIPKAETSLQPRPQEPKKPYNYISEDVFFENPKADNIKLAGTLTLPNDVKNPPVAILISGSGPQNRDSEVKAFNHRTFLVLADFLTNHGIAVLRYDDRGVAASEGSQLNATSADFATDVEAAVNYLKSRDDIDTKKIGLIGHSEGGFIAPMVASTDNTIAFVVLLAGIGVDGGQVLITQTRRALELSGLPESYVDINEILTAELHNLVRETSDIGELKSKIISHLENYRANNNNEVSKNLTDPTIQQYTQLASPWMVYFIKTNPDQFLSKVTCPILAMNGDKDFQVLSKLNLDAIKMSLSKGNNTDTTIIALPDLNHLFQKAETGSLEEYSQIQETFNLDALVLIKNWILERFN